MPGSLQRSDRRQAVDGEATPTASDACEYDGGRVPVGEELILTDMQFPTQRESPERLDRSIERLTAFTAEFADNGKIVLEREDEIRQLARPKTPKNIIG